MTDAREQSLEEIEGDAWGDAPADATRLIATVHQLRRKPIGKLDVEDLRIMLGQQVGVPVLVPEALVVLEHDPLAEGDFYPGDLLSAVVRRTPVEYWVAHPDELLRLHAVVAGIDLDEIDDNKLVADLTAFRENAATQRPSPSQGVL
ncbi:contact-dependent growth inhibition system immunity protein [Actinoplanes sp. NPDC020271]|uniref:contact-dependent growth inhibition system immunity protein n=1 Tax=Actinoplanes sp. NPDC020271 TaxID=3363896 RepID=UPI0037BDC999